MIASPATIWRVPAYLPYLQPALTDRSLAQAQRHIGLHLPDSYVALLRVQNGGYIRYSLPESVHGQIYGIGPHFPSLTRFDWGERQEHVSYQLQGLIPFDGDGHWHLCLDYRRNSKCAAVTLVDIECDNESEVACSFDRYLTLLRLNIENGDFVMVGVSDLPRALKGIATRLGVQFEPPDSLAHGYPIYRARGGTKNSPEWIWISPNMVRRGFVRKDDPRFEELRSLMPGDAPRYPEVPETSYLLTVTDALRPHVLRACSALSIDVRPLIEYAT